MSARKTKTIIRWTAWTAGALLLGVVVWFLIRYAPDLWAIFRSNNSSAAMKDFIAGLGGWGVLVLVLLQALQIAVAFLPGEPVELSAGILYGGFWGSVLCLIGVLLGSALVYWAVMKLGHSVIEAFHDGRSLQKMRRLKAFQEEKSAEALTFLLFLIPGVPKDFLTFVAPLTPMKPHRFLLISTLGRAPGMFITTYAGQSILSGNLTLAAILYGILLIGVIIGYFFYRRVTRQPDRAKDREE
ncbi:MAG: TVP38/TMEM64 family protein [Oscillospiraceae bacterium]|nr:TVP38/TMEM64 family protein [Oscillospiraceae bacterium]